MADSKRPMLEGHHPPTKCPHMSMIVSRLIIATFSELSVDQVAMILEFFHPMEIIPKSLQNLERGGKGYHRPYANTLLLWEGFPHQYFSKVQRLESDGDGAAKFAAI